METRAKRWEEPSPEPGFQPLEPTMPASTLYSPLLGLRLLPPQEGFHLCRAKPASPQDRWGTVSWADKESRCEIQETLTESEELGRAVRSLRQEQQPEALAGPQLCIQESVPPRLGWDGLTLSGTEAAQTPVYTQESECRNWQEQQVFRFLNAPRE